MANLRANKITTGTADYQGSIYANGTGAYLFTKTTAPGTDDFTIECWFNSDAADGGTQEGVFAINAAATGFQSGSGNQIRLVQGRNGGTQTGGLEVNINGTAVGTANGADLIAEGTWYHVAVTRASGTVKIWIDGVEKASGSAAGDVTGTTFITGYYDGGYTFQGYMSNFRYRKGTAYYTTTFTPPTGPLERTTDTELLFAQSVNNAGNGYSSAIAGGTTDIMQVNGNVTANTSAPTQTLTTTSDVGVVFDGPIKINTQGAMYFPTGDTSQRGRGRGLIGNVGGEFSNGIHYVQIQTSGNSIDFGDTTIAKRRESVVCSATRGLFAGGDAPSGGSETNVISSVEIATTGNAVDYGDLTAASGMGSGCSSNTRGVIMLGYDHPTAVVNLDYVTIATTGNAADFGDSTEARNNTGSLSSPTRGIFAGGTPSYKSTIDYVTIASTGNATDFGDFDRNVMTPAGASSSTRGVFCAGGANMSPNQFANNRMEYITIASTGNTVHFGDLQHKRGNASGLSNSTTAVIAGGCTDNGGSTATNAMEFITIATTGNGVEFGDTTATCLRTQGTSDSHGGLS